MESCQSKFYNTLHRSFSEIPPCNDYKNIYICSVLIEYGFNDDNCPYPELDNMWWNVLQFGFENRMTQIATQTCDGLTGYNELWIRSSQETHGWLSWKKIG